MCGLDRDPDRPVAAADARAAAEQLFARSGKPVFVSRGQRGVIVADRAGSHAVPGLHLPGPVDPVGAGDSMLAGIAAATAAGRSPREAAIFGNFSAAVTTRKLFQTGRATPAEILAIGTDPDYAAEP